MQIHDNSVRKCAHRQTNCLKEVAIFCVHTHMQSTEWRNNNGAMNKIGAKCTITDIDRHTEKENERADSKL